MMRLAALILLLLLTPLVASCSQPPDLPDDDSTTYRILVSKDGQEFLKRISTYQWEDGGQAPAARLHWIGRDALSPDPVLAQSAGKAAHVIATFLEQEMSALMEIDTAWFVRKDKSVGEVNPQLVQSYSAALMPFAPGLVGDADGLRGFDPIASPGTGELAAARRIVAVLGTNTQAANEFKDAAYERVYQYLRVFAQSVAHRTSDGQVALQHAAELAGVIAGGQRESGNEAIETRTGQYWVNWAAYEVAVALGANPADSDIGGQFFDMRGRLMSPDEISPNDLFHYATGVENFASHHGLRDLGSKFDGWFDEAEGN